MVTTETEVMMITTMTVSHGPGNGWRPMGGGIWVLECDDCVDDGDFVEIEVDLQNTPQCCQTREGEAEWEMNY